MKIYYYVLYYMYYITIAAIIGSTVFTTYCLITSASYSVVGGLFAIYMSVIFHLIIRWFMAVAVEIEGS